jgi:hypothetical protein
MLFRPHFAGVNWTQLRAGAPCSPADASAATRFVENVTACQLPRTVAAAGIFDGYEKEDRLGDRAGATMCEQVSAVEKRGRRAELPEALHQR